MKRAAVFLNGELTDTSLIKKILKKSDLLVGVDGGTKQILKLKLIPDLIIGDIDSLAVLPNHVPLIKFPTDKNQTDTELGIQHLISQGYRQFLILGFLGRRLDHLLSNIMFLGRQKVEVQIIEGRQRIYFVSRRLLITGQPGDLVSLIPLLTDCQKVSTQGLKWSLNQAIIKLGTGLGVSNEMTGKKAQVRLKSGLLMIIQTQRL